MPRDEERIAYDHGVALWKLFLGLCGMVFAIEIADRYGGWITLFSFALMTAVFVYSGWRWGRDSRDGADWKPLPIKPKADDEDES